MNSVIQNIRREKGTLGFQNSVEETQQDNKKKVISLKGVKRKRQKKIQKWRKKIWAFKDHFRKFNNQKEIAKKEKDQDTIKELTENTLSEHIDVSFLIEKGPWIVSKLDQKNGPY